MRVTQGNQGRIVGCAERREGGLLFMDDGM